MTAPAHPDQARAAAERAEDRGWVPVDRRVAGFDRRTIWPGVVLLVVWFTWSHITPWVNEQITSDDPIEQGDVIDLAEGNLTFVPTEGWNLDSGLRVGTPGRERVALPSDTTLSSDTVVYTVHVGPWDGTDEELLDRVIDLDDTLIGEREQGREAITNADGVPGQLAYIESPDGSALVATFVFGEDEGASSPLGVEITARAEPDDLRDEAEAIASMIDSTVLTTDDQEAGE
jgi:hypothetical protein